MKKIKTILPCLLVLVMMAMLCGSAMAAETVYPFRVTVDKTEIAVGDTVTVQVYGPKAKVIGAEFNVVYDQEKFECVSHTLNTDTLKRNVDQDGIVTVGRAEITPYDTENGLWATMVFRAKASQGTGSFSYDAMLFNADLNTETIDLPQTTTIAITDQPKKEDKPQPSQPGTENPAEQKPAKPQVYFSDVHGANHWAVGAVEFAVEHGLFNGVSATEFAPDHPMTRGMLMTVLARMGGQDTSGGSVWYEKGMEWTKAQGISDGTNPNGHVTREQLAAMLYRYAGAPAPTGELSQFPDAAAVSAYAVDAMRWAVGNGLINGMDGQLQPGGNATRAQVAAILMRYSNMQ